MNSKHKINISKALKGVPKGYVRCKICRHIMQKHDACGRLCSVCSSKKKLCDCGCKETVDKYTPSGYVRQFKNRSHANSARAVHDKTREKMRIRKCGNVNARGKRSGDALSNIRKAAKSRRGVKLSENHRNGISVSLCEYYTTPEARQRASIIASKALNRPEVRKRISDGNKKRYRDLKEREKTAASARMMFEKRPELRVKASIAMRERNLKIWKDPNYRESKSQQMREMWSDPVFRAAHSGEHHGSWRGGKSFEPYDEKFNKSFKLSIRTRQHFQCADRNETCNRHDYELDVHHIDGDKLNTIPENCIALCRSHHIRAHNDIESQTRHYACVRSLMCGF